MKILLVHSFYRSSTPSGENKVLAVEKALLHRHGHDVHTFSRRSDDLSAEGSWGVLKGAASTPWNPWMATALRRTVERIEPDVVHVHNTFPLISPAIFHAIGKRAARVLTLHNYRLFCPAAVPMREGRVCTECMDRHTVWPALRYGCYRNSRIATLPLAAGVALHRLLGTWQMEVDAFVALTDFQRRRMVDAGLPGNKVYVKPNFFPGAPEVLPWSDREDYVLFAGRLGEEKGVRHLVRAWLKWGTDAPELRIVGDGPLREELTHLASTEPECPIRFIGQVDGEGVRRQVERARLIVLPSLWFETFGLVISEAFAFGIPVAVSAIGPLPSIVVDGVSGIVFTAGDADALLDRIRACWNEPGLLEKLGKGARASYEREYNEEANYQMLMDIYREAISEAAAHGA